MKLSLYLFWFSCLVTSEYNLCMGQNLVPNPSFEDYNSCPTGSSQVGYSANNNFFPTVKHWVNPLANTTPDYYNACNAVPYTFGVPVNCVANQLAKSGSGYVGMYLLADVSNACNAPGDASEYVECHLVQPLTAGHKYLVTFNGNLSIYKWALDRVGIHFSTAPVNSGIAQMLSLPAHVVQPGKYIDDTTNWEVVQGIYTATGGEEWLTLGRFCDGLPVNPIAVNTWSTVEKCYILVDDVCVLDISVPGNVQVYDTTICGTFPQVLSPPSHVGEHEWNTGDTGAIISVSSPGVYWRQTSGDCAFYIDTIRVYQGAATSNDTVVCTSTFPVVLSSATAGSSYVWSTNDTSATLAISSVGTYWRQSYINCSVTTDTFKVYMEAIDLSLGPDSAYCYGTPVTISANATYESYNWSSGQVSSFITVNQAGQYVLTVDDMCGTQSDTINITYKEIVEPPSVSDTMICINADSPVIPVEGIALLWYETLGGTGMTSQPVINTSSSATQSIYVSQTVDGCESDKAVFTVTITSPPSFDLGHDTSLCVGDRYFLGYEGLGASYLWNTGAEVCCVEADSGFYILQVGNICGSYTDSIHINRNRCDGCFYVPSAFTPNSDSKNDFFRVVNLCPLSSYSLIVVNRWGEVVFESNSYNDVWNGKYKGHACDIGTYQFMILYKVTSISGEKQMLKGTVTLLK